MIKLLLIKEGKKIDRRVYGTIFEKGVHLFGCVEDEWAREAKMREKDIAILFNFLFLAGKCDANVGKGGTGAALEPGAICDQWDDVWVWLVDLVTAFSEPLKTISSRSCLRGGETSSGDDI